MGGKARVRWHQPGSPKSKEALCVTLPFWRKKKKKIKFRVTETDHVEKWISSYARGV